MKENKFVSLGNTFNIIPPKAPKKHEEIPIQEVEFPGAQKPFTKAYKDKKSRRKRKIKG